MDNNESVENLVTEEKEVVDTKKEEKEEIAKDAERSDADRTIELEKELEEKKKEAESNLDKLLRLHAEFENYKKRISKERIEFAKFVNENLLKELLPVLDNLERAVNSAKNDKVFDSLKEGVDMTLKQFTGVLEKAGLKEITSIGETFDPNRHEALLMIESDEHEKNTIVEEHQKGYLLNNRVLRPSKVVVSKKNKTQKEECKNE
ncbi:MAG: nucleotide exchange factor GrpE [Nitrospinota bacterium]